MRFRRLMASERGGRCVITGSHAAVASKLPTVLGPWVLGLRVHRSSSSRERRWHGAGPPIASLRDSEPFRQTLSPSTCSGGCLGVATRRDWTTAELVERQAFGEGVAPTSPGTQP